VVLKCNFNERNSNLRHVQQHIIDTYEEEGQDDIPSNLKLTIKGDFHTSPAYGEKKYVGVLPLFWEKTRSKKVPEISPKVSICLGPLFGDALSIQKKISKWARYHHNLGIERVYAYSLFENFSVEFLDPSFLQIIPSRSFLKGEHPVVQNNLQNHPYRDQSTLYAHCWLKYSTEADWLVNMDFDEYLYLNHDVPLKTYF